MNCDTCKHFTALKKEKDYENEFNPQLGECKKVIRTIPYTQKKYTGVAQILFKDISQVKQSDSIIEISEWGDDTKCLVGKNFGCIHHENTNNMLLSGIKIEK